MSFGAHSNPSTRKWAYVTEQAFVHGHILHRVYAGPLRTTGIVHSPLPHRLSCQSARAVHGRVPC
eukprot:scaffold68146_cov20-Tisochrysis_lutea.AAC.1